MRRVALLLAFLPGWLCAQADEQATDQDHALCATWLSSISCPADLISNHTFLAATILPLLPPEPGLLVRHGAGVFLFGTGALPEAMLSELDTEVQGGMALYELFVYEDAVTRERCICNGDGKLLWSVAAPARYDPFAAAHAVWPWLSSLSASDAIRLWYEETFDPARVITRFLLLPLDKLAAYEEGMESELLVQEWLRAEEMMLDGMLADTNAFLIAGIVVSNGTVTLEVQRPPDFTNRLDIFGCTNLPPLALWQLLTTTPTSTCRTESVSIVWSNTTCFFRVGDADTDSDGDGLPDAREMLLYGTDPNLADTDCDGLPDGWEINNGLDPLTADALADPDNDRVPNSYEYKHGTNPTNADNHLIATMRVDPAGAATNSALYTCIRDALAASTPYAVIEIVDGLYTGRDNTDIWFPTHPVLLMSENWGASRLAVVRYEEDLAAFYLDANQDNRTIIRGLTLRLGGVANYQIGFWLGNGTLIAPGMGAAPTFDGVTVELGASDVNVGFFCRHAAANAIRFENCVIRGQRGTSKPMRGIYAIDSPALYLHNCTFQNFAPEPFSYGIQFESTYGNFGAATNPVAVDIVNCVWDESFAHSNVEAFVRLENGVAYHVSMANSIVPRVLTWFPPDAQSGLIVTNANLAMGGHQRSGSPGIDAGLAPAPALDFEGQSRDGAPDIGADEYAGYATGDSDGDGIGNYGEVETYGSDPYDSDSDNDGVDDGAEAGAGTDPTNPFSFRVTVLGSVSNRTGSTAPVRACYGWAESAWNDVTAETVPAPGDFDLVVLSEQANSGAWVNVSCDFNANGVVDLTTEPVYSQPVVVTGACCQMSFDLRDYDGDGIPDWEEVQCGTDPRCATNYCVTIIGTMTNISPTAECFRAGCSFTANGTAMLAETNVTASGFLLRHVTVNAPGTLKVHLYDDINSNAVLDADEAFATQILSITGAVSAIKFDGSLAYCDRDSDGITDFWEARNGLSWTNAADACENPDGDGLINLHESWCQTDPWTADGTDFALSDAALAIDSRIAGKNPTNALPIFVDYLANGANGVFIRNTNCWAADLDLTCCSPWNSNARNRKAGTLISPRHVLFVVHSYYTPPVGTTMFFVGKTNDIIARTLVATVQHPDCPPPPNGTFPDIAVGLLDSAVPTNSISFARVLPDDYGTYVYTGMKMPCLRIDQEEKALVGDVAVIASLSKSTSATVPATPDRLRLYENLIQGDSGNPMFIAIHDQPVLLTLWTGGLGGSGTSTTMFKDDINALMRELGGTYQLESVKLSAFAVVK